MKCYRLSFIWFSTNALLIALAINAQPPPIPPKLMHYSTATPKKPATQQMLGAKVSLALVAPQLPRTNYTTLSFYSGVDYNAQHLIRLQSKSSMSMSFTNSVYWFQMTDSNITVTISSTNKERYYRLMWNSGFSIPPLLLNLTNK